MRGQLQIVTYNGSGYDEAGYNGSEWLSLNEAGCDEVVAKYLESSYKVSATLRCCQPDRHQLRRALSEVTLESLHEPAI